MMRHYLTLSYCKSATYTGILYTNNTNPNKQGEKMSIPTTPFVKHFVVEPGNMTRYELLYSVYEDSQYGVPHCSFTWLRKGTGGETFVWPKGSPIYSSYVSEKVNINSADLAAILCTIKKRYPCRS